MIMALRLRSTCFSGLFLALIVFRFSLSAALIASQDINPPYPKAISDLREAIVKGFGFPAEDLRISGFDLNDALVGRSVAYEFDIEIDNKVLPFKLLEDVNKWDYVDLPIFRVEDPARAEEKNGLVEKRQLDEQMPVLAPFQLAGPMELWIQDAKDMRISLPHDIDAGVLKKVILADGAVVTVKGARSVSLRHPVELPLPLNRTGNGFAAGLMTLAERLRRASRNQDSPLLSLRIVGPTSLTSPSSSASSVNNKLKPETVKMHFEVLAKVDGDKVVPEKVMQVNPVTVEDSVAPNVLAGNLTMSKIPIVHQPPNPFSL